MYELYFILTAMWKLAYTCHMLGLNKLSVILEQNRYSVVKDSVYSSKL